MCIESIAMLRGSVQLVHSAALAASYKDVKKETRNTSAS